MTRWSGPCVAFALMANSSRAWGEEASAVTSRDVIVARDGTAPPAGFHAERRARWGLIISGAAVAGAGGLFLGTGLEQRADSENRRSNVPGTPGSGGEFFIIAGGAMLAVGLPLLAYGLLSPRRVYVRDTPQALTLRVSPGPQAWSANVALTF